MRKRNYIVAAALMMLGCMSSPLALLSQSRSTLTRTALSRMDVLSRAALFEAVIAEAARKQAVDPLVLWTIAYNETRFRPWLTSPKKAQGMMQFTPESAARFGLADPYEPSASIDAAARYVKYLGGLFDWRLESVFAAYNAGERAVLAYLNGTRLRLQGKIINPSEKRTAGGVPPYRETVRYVSQGLKIYRWLKAQGRFGEKVRADSMARAASTKETFIISPSAPVVFYDARTGSRSLVDRTTNTLKRIEQPGPVIISPELRGLPTRRAKSTFAGTGKP